MREEEKNEQKQEQIAPRLQEGPAGSLAVTLGHMPSAAAGWPASSTWAGFFHVSLRNAATVWIKAALFGGLRGGRAEPCPGEVTGPYEGHRPL